MPSDIRSFFGGKPAATPAPKPTKEANGTKRGRGRKVVSDDDEEDESASLKKKKGSTPQKKRKQPEPEPEPEETTASEYFGKASKPKRNEAARPKTKEKPAEESKIEEDVKPAKRNTKARSGTKKRAYAESDENDFPDDDLDGAEDNAKAGVKTGRQMGDDYEEGSEEDDEVPLRPKKAAAGGRQKNAKKEDEDLEEVKEEDVHMQDADDDFVVPDEEPAKSKPAKTAGRKRKSAALSDDEDAQEVEQKNPAKKSPVKKTAAKKTKKDPEQDSAAMQAIFDSIPTVDAPSPPPKDDDGAKPKFNYGAHANSAVPAGAIDPSSLPSGNDNCLAGLTFVFTGQLQHIGRDQGMNLVKEYGGKTTTGPSKKTSYVVLGEDAGPKKLGTIKQYGLKTINEEGLFELIKRLPANGGDSKAAGAMAEKREKDEEKIRKAAEEMEREERAAKDAAQKKAKSQGTSAAKPDSKDGGSKGKQSADGPDTRLWTVRYAPSQLGQICGNKSQVEKLQMWLRMFPKNQRTKFRMPGKDGSGTFRAVMIHGPPGIGKTTAAHLVAKLEGYDIVESNASDTRSKKLVETGLKGVLSTTSLMGYFGGPGNNDVDASKKKLVLIMDEVDGMSAGDRGGVGALAAVCKKSQIPMILICNERRQPKMKPFDFVTFDLGFRRPTVDMIKSRISTIAFREGLKIPPNVIGALIEGSGADIRQVVNMISTAKLDGQALNYEDGKDMSKAWEKHIVLKPWDMVSKILGGGLFNPAAKSSLNDKQELYFNDHDFAPLMLQENYLGTSPTRANMHRDNPKMQKLAKLDLISKAADSISDGDLVDRMIHGSQQQWGLMPTHAMFSFVRPASFIYGTMAGHQTRFTSWLGKNSSQSKLMRMTKEIQGHMRLRTSADRYEVRQTYLPLLFDRLVRRLQKEGKEAVPEIIELMDEYYLTREDWDAILELGVGKDDMEGIKIETQAKSTFTRLYNQQSHPLPFMKASEVVNPKRAGPKERPDLEEALEASDDEAAAPADDDAKNDDDDGGDVMKDKYVKAPKKKKAAAGGAKGKGKKKADDDEEEEEAPKKGKGKAKGKAKK